MENKNRLNSMVRFIREYVGRHPCYSLPDLTAALKRTFALSQPEAEKLAKLADHELAQAKLGLAAIELNVTFNCNLTCEYCFIHCKSPEERMSFATAKKAIDLLMDKAIFSNVVITLIGGEPLLEFGLIKEIVPYALRRAKEKNLAITWALTTNGTLLNEEMLRFFSQNHINILLSIDGGQETHDRYRRTRNGEGTWQKIANLIPLIKKYQPWLGARMTVSKEAINTMRQDFHQIVQLGINQLIIAPAQGAEPWHLEQIERYGKNMVKILEDYHNYQRQGKALFIEEFEKDDRERLGWGCRAGSTSLAIAPNGDISPCSKLLGLTDKAGRYIVGNVHTGLDAKKLAPFQNAISRQPGHCRNCSRPCAGGCYAVNFEQTGDHFTPPLENCLFWVVGQETKRMSRWMRFC
ncbi:radical SAM/SPASM domain-containing protein [Desulforamulus ferrireducens]|uniref:Radical SAM protein n=1 Tax=Desulforamulus ferrireducens TaxID=1833852 RepID=A0A1S6IZ30_9FIRM|nr:radical SAM protein [Desulforamulus ferrireducens]AQS60029.1 radical SAM protein [Desulforamulus ferrireducens]